MRIGIDIDDTMTDTSMIIDKYSKMINKNDITSNVDFVNLKTNELNSYKLLLEKYIDEVFDNCTLKENCVEVINKLKSNGHKIYLITARSNIYSNNTKDITINFLKRNNIVYDGIYFDYEYKKDICEKLELDYMIDDNIEVYNSLLGTKVKPILLEKEFTKGLDIVKVNKWVDILDVIK